MLISGTGHERFSTNTAHFWTKNTSAIRCARSYRTLRDGLFLGTLSQARRARLRSVCPYGTWLAAISEQPPLLINGSQGAPPRASGWFRHRSCERLTAQSKKFHRAPLRTLCLCGENIVLRVLSSPLHFSTFAARSYCRKNSWPSCALSC